MSTYVAQCTTLSVHLDGSSTLSYDKCHQFNVWGRSESVTGAGDNVSSESAQFFYRYFLQGTYHYWDKRRS